MENAIIAFWTIGILGTVALIIIIILFLVALFQIVGQLKELNMRLDKINNYIIDLSNGMRYVHEESTLHNNLLLLSHDMQDENRRDIILNFLINKRAKCGNIEKALLWKLQDGEKSDNTINENEGE